MSAIKENPSIAKNTLFLYSRMALAMLIGLFTSRVILNALGEVDYGVYAVVGSVVSLFGFINASLSGSVGRFFTISLGRGEEERLSKLFATAFNLHLALAIIMAIGLETVGMWFMYNKMTIPKESLPAAFWVLQFSIVSMIFGYTQVPYNASLVSHENMKMYAYMGIYDSLSKLVIVIWVACSDGQRLVFYAFLVMVNGLITQLIFRAYAIRHYKECRVRLILDKPIMKEVLGYCGWDLFGNCAVMCQGAAMNVLLNVFFGPIVNAARAIALTLQGAVGAFVSGFTTSSRPRGMKYAAVGDYKDMYSLVFRTAKVAFFLMLILAIPVCYNVEDLLQIWLGDNVPKDTGIFTIIVILGALIQTYHSAYLIAFHGIGRIKFGNIVNGTLMILSLPIAYIFLKLGAPAWSVFAITVTINMIAHIIGWCIVYGYVPFNIPRLLFTVYVPTLTVTLLGCIVPTSLYFALPVGWSRLIISTALTECTLFMLIFFVGFSAEERSLYIYPIVRKLKTIILRKQIKCT